MKITIAYLPGEEHRAAQIRDIVKGIAPGAKVRESDRHAPYQHIYITTKKSENDCGSKGNA